MENPENIAAGDVVWHKTGDGRSKFLVTELTDVNGQAHAKCSWSEGNIVFTDSIPLVALTKTEAPKKSNTIWRT